MYQVLVNGTDYILSYVYGWHLLLLLVRRCECYYHIVRVKSACITRSMDYFLVH